MKKSQVISAEDRVPLKEKMALGAGALASLFGYVGISTLAYPVYNMILGVNAGLVGMALMIPRIWDAFTDPVMGKISDNFRSKYGRRRPFIVIGAILMGLTFALIWFVPEGWSEGAKLTYFIITQILFFTFYTVFSIPFYSLTYEMTPDYNERTRVMAFTALFHKVGEFFYQWMIPLAALFSLHVFASKEITLPGVRMVAWIVGLVILAGFGVIPGLFVRERFRKKTEHQEKVKLLAGVKESFGNKAFLVLVSVIVLNTLSGVLAMGIDHYILIYYMGDGNIALGSIWKALLSCGYAVVGIGSIPIITWLANRFGKKGSLYFVYSLMVIGGVMKWFIFQPGHHIYNINLGLVTFAFDPIILIDPLLCGPMWVAVKIMLASMMADICDDDELRYGNRREGMFGSVFSWVEKATVSLSYLGTGLALNWSGFDRNLGGNQATETFTMMRLFLAGAPTITAVFALVALRFYPIDAERAAETRQKLEQRRGR